jgi:hypothetical protein
MSPHGTSNTPGNSASASGTVQLASKIGMRYCREQPSEDEDGPDQNPRESASAIVGASNLTAGCPGARRRPEKGLGRAE